jgi:hypothetical protein
MRLTVPEPYQHQYLEVLLANHDIDSTNKFDLGKTDTLLHELLLKTEEPIYVKQFKILLPIDKK